MRLHQGDYASSTVYDADPVGLAKRLSDQGASWIHIVDLDAARGQGAHNRDIIAAIRRAVPARMEVGGGVRTQIDAQALIAIGVDRIVVGTTLVQAPREVAQWAELFGHRFVGGIDARDGRVKIAGWAEDAQVSDQEFASRLSGLGLAGVIYTNIARDGTLFGPDVDRTSRVAAAAGLPTILSGGIGSAVDIELVHARQDPWIRGVILGKAMYEGKVELAEVIRRFGHGQTDW